MSECLNVAIKAIHCVETAGTADRFGVGLSGKNASPGSVASRDPRLTSAVPYGSTDHFWLVAYSKKASGRWYGSRFVPFGPSSQRDLRE